MPTLEFFRLCVIENSLFIELQSDFEINELSESKIKMRGTFKLASAAILLLLIAYAKTEDQIDALQDLDDTIIDIDDGDLDQEQRRRHLGGPWTAIQAISILHEAIDQLRGPNRETRQRLFAPQAASLLSIITGLENPRIEDDTATDTSFDDPDWFAEEDGASSAHEHSLDTIKRIINMIDGTNGEKRRTFEGIEKLYPWMRPNYIARFRSRLDLTRIQKLREIDAATFAKFKEARSKLQPVHGRTIQRWARQHASAINLNSFKASQSWLKVFNNRHGIVSRKVTSYLGRAERDKSESIAASIVAFGLEYSPLSRRFPKNNIFNFDQTGFLQEPSNLRTLSFKGERDTNLLVNDKNKHTHSYTATPMISRSGRLFPRLMLVMQEETKFGKFGPRVSKRVRELRLRSIEI